MPGIPIFLQTTQGIFDMPDAPGGFYTSDVYLVDNFSTIFTSWAVNSVVDGGSGLTDSAGVELWTRVSGGTWVIMQPPPGGLSMPIPAPGFLTFLGLGLLAELYVIMFIPDPSVVGASLLTTFPDDNSNILWELGSTSGASFIGGAGQNAFGIQYVDPGVTDAELAISFDPYMSLFTFSLATDSSRAITTTANELASLGVASGMPFEPQAVQQGDGTGVVTALPATNFSGGVDGDSTWNVRLSGQFFA